MFHKLPGNSGQFSVRFDQTGRRLQTTYPSGSHIVLRRYTAAGRLARVVSGDRETVYAYNDDVSSGKKPLTASVVHQQRDVSVKTKFVFMQQENGPRGGGVVGGGGEEEEEEGGAYRRQRKAGLLTEQRINFDAKSALADAKFSYKYRNDLTLMERRGRIGGQTIPRVGLFPLPPSSSSSSLSSQGNRQPGGGNNREHGNFYLTANGSRLTDGNAIYQRTDTLVTLSIGGREVFSAELAYNGCNRLRQNAMMLKRSSEFFKQVKEYGYDAAGQITEVRENNHVWKYEYDANGNMKKLIFGKTEHVFDYDSWDQLVRYNTAVLAYDAQGRMVKNHKEWNFVYGSGNLLVEASCRQNKKQQRMVYYYDHLDRLVGWRGDERGQITQFYYSLTARPYLVSHIYLPREDTLTSLVYDAADNLVYARVQEAGYYIVSDQTGAPFLFFTRSGNLAKEVNRSPYGQITYDSNPEIVIPLGPGGSIVDPATGLLHVQRPPRGKRAREKIYSRQIVR